MEVQVQARKITKEFEQVRGSALWNPYHRGYDVNPIVIIYSSPYEDFNDEEGWPRRRRHPRDDLRDLKIDPTKFDGNFNPENYLD